MWIRAGSASLALLVLVLVAIMPYTGDAESRQAAAVDRALPAGELLKAQRIALAGFVDRKQAPGDGCNDFGLAAHDPAGRPGRRKRLERQGLAERADYLGRTNLLVLEHLKSHLLNHCYWTAFNPGSLKIF